jgi:hypothetical protein
MTTLLSLPDEILLKILRWAFKDHQPLTSFAELDLPNFTPNKRLRRLAFEAGLDSVDLSLQQPGYIQYITKTQSWHYVRHLHIFVFGSRGPSDAIRACDVTAQPRHITLTIYGPYSSQWWEEFPFAAEAVSSIHLWCCDMPSSDISFVLQLFSNLNTFLIEDEHGNAIPAALATYPRLLHLGLEGFANAGMERLSVAFPKLESLALSADSDFQKVACPSDLLRLRVQIQRATSTQCSMAFAKFATLCKLQVLSINGDPFHNETGVDNQVAALAMTPASVRHLALDLGSGIHFLAALVQLAARSNWLPNLQSLAVLPWGDQESQDALKEACAVYKPHVRLYCGSDYHANFCH